jgi:hypothetical protein
MNFKTGAVILALIGTIFSVDALLAVYDHATISEWFYNWLHSGVEAQWIFVGGLTLLTAHFWWFRPKQ